MAETILVTGASAGFGQAICHRLVADGHRVIGAARRIEKLQALQEELGEAFYPLQMDVTDLSQVDHALASLPKAWERVDVLINNAGLALGLAPAYEAELASIWDQLLGRCLIQGPMCMVLPRPSLNSSH